jgi:hypothetical protein
MKYNLQKNKENPENDMRLIDVETGDVLGHILRWREYHTYWFRTTVTMNGLVYGRDTENVKQSIAFILEKRDLLNDDLKRELSN